MTVPPPPPPPPSKAEIFPEPNRPGAENILLAEGLAKTYRGKDALSDVSIRVRGGEIVGLLGPNGAGKTTCFHLIMGLSRPTRGGVALNGADISNLPMHKRALRGLSYLPQESSVFSGLSARDNVLAALEIRGRRGESAKARAEALLQEMGVRHLRDHSAATLSGGERRRVEIARLLAVEPKFVLMDEPFAAIEPIAVRDLQEIIFGLKRRGIGVFITDHNVRETLRICDRAYILHGGQALVEGGPDEIVANPAARRIYLGEDFAV